MKDNHKMIKKSMNRYIYSFIHMLSYMSQEHFKDLIIGCLFKIKSFDIKPFMAYFYF